MFEFDAVCVSNVSPVKWPEVEECDQVFMSMFTDLFEDEITCSKAELFQEIAPQIKSLYVGARWVAFELDVLENMCPVCLLQ